MHFQEILNNYNQYRIKNTFQGNPENLYQPINYIMDLGGKRIRPVLSIASCLATGGTMEQALPTAHAIEVFHNFTLLHDDIMDQAPTRRGKQTVHLLHGIPAAILSGDNMLILSMQLMATQPNHSLNLFLKTAQQVCEGQQMDMNFETQNQITMPQYMHMIELKTAVLLGAACYIGAASAQQTSAICQQYYQIGLQLGLAFQMQDDWLDTFGSSEQTGKIEGGDIITRKKMWLYIKAKEKNSQIDSIYAIENETERIQKAQALFKEMQLDTALIEAQNKHYQQAQTILHQLNIAPTHMQVFEQIAQFLTQRKS